MGVTENDDLVADADLVSGGAVGADGAAPARSFDDISDEPFAVGYIDHMHLLVLDQPGEVHEILVDGERAHVLDVGLGNPGGMDLGSEEYSQHGEGLNRSRMNCARKMSRSRSPISLPAFF